MKNDIKRMALDLFYTACYIYLAHVGYELVDGLTQTNNDYSIYIVFWVAAASLMFYLTKKRYDEEQAENE
jgi:hypothetical protein